MKTPRRNFILFCILLCIPLLTVAQTGRYFSTDNGLSSSLINQLYQDRKGFIWIATEYGLNKFDGTRFSVYKHIEGDSCSLKNNYVRSLFEDSKERFWIGYINGLMRYDRGTDDFREIKILREGKQVFPHVVQTLELSNNKILIATAGHGIFTLDEKEMQANDTDDINKQLSSNYISCIYEDSGHNLWIGTENQGVVCYNPDTNRSMSFKYPEISGNKVSSILEDKNGNIFVGTLTQGINRYDRESKKFSAIPYKGDSKLLVKHLAIIGDKLYAGTDGQGLKIYNEETRSIDDYYINSAPFDFSEGKVHYILQDRDHNIWLGLFQKGVVFMPRQGNMFQYYGHKSIHYNPIGTGCVMAVYKDSNHHLWISGDNEGIYELDESGRRIHHYQPKKDAGAISNTILCMFEDSRHNFWLGSYTSGLALMNRKTGECKYLPEFINEKIYCITEDKHSTLYIATLGSGLYSYDLNTKEVKRYESSQKNSADAQQDAIFNDWINHVLCDSEGLIWLAHYKGISCYNPKTESFVNYQQSNNLFPGCIGYSLLEDYTGNIWAGTSDGLYYYDKKTEQTYHYTTADGLSNNVICGLCEDEDHNIWMSTYMGISKYDTKEKRFINYYAGDGLQGNEFTHGAFYKDEKGKIYFGGIYGVTCFNPKDIVEHNQKVELSITDFYVFNHPINKKSLSDGNSIISTSVPDADLYRLSYKDNTFSIVFSTLKYDNPERIVYQYRIKELSEQWLNTEPGVNRVTYNNLPHGKYTFEVRASNYGNHPTHTHTIKIVITPPWYQSWWAYIIYAALGVLLILGIMNYVMARIRHRRELMQREQMEMINEAKLQFFINISHEIRTPMTLIINPLEKLLAEGKDSEVHKTYLMIYRNAQRILRLINQLMDIRKLDKGQMFMKFRETDMVGFINDLMLTFEYMARKKDIRFTFEHTEPQLKVWVDLNNFDKILMNILSNAFKYTPEHGEIHVKLSTGHNNGYKDALKNYFEITVTDSGIGIDREKIERIFERFYQIDNDVTNSNFGTGIGLHLSRSLVRLHHGIILAENREDGPGSRFTIRIPLGSAHLLDSELENPDTDTVRKRAIMAKEQPELSEGIALAEEEETKKGVRAKTNMRLLIVEDEEEIRSYLNDELSGEYKITTCKNGKEAYDIILTNTPDLVISDIMMPEMDGITLCRKVKQNVNVNHVPIILLTAKSKPEDKMEGMEIGADAYMIKPFNTELLKSTIANLIANRKLLKSKFSGAQQQGDKIQKINLKSSDEILMNKIMKVINENIADPSLNVETLAGSVGLSRVHIHRKLKELTNLSARDFIKSIRLKQAATLLQEKKLTISEVAYATGFTNPSHFSNSFKEFYGTSPKDYMSAHLNEQEAVDDQSQAERSDGVSKL
jgi:signal transduction histidine kinase/ligand-binding sensor domain-containing protein/AraC-like DNA-binding protein